MLRNWNVVALAIVIMMILSACNSGDNEEGTAPEENQNEEMPQVNLDVNDYPEVVATVNGDDIARDEFVPYLENQANMLVAFYGYDLESEEGKETLQELEQAVLDVLVQDRLIMQKVEESDYEVTEEELDQRYEMVLVQYGSGSEKELEEELEEYGFTLEDLRMDLEFQMKRDQYMNDHITFEEVTEDEVVTLYESRAEANEEIGELEEERETLEAELVNQRRLEATQQHYEELKEDSEIDIHL
ncbi:SurA N-terminal domain-containing protein [Alkalihalobacillus pseudalcaliphilus]|uniref:SurA N-terminal domain-containing protein n=1 Tax=Alkalihalobacillus pseudalcaliphilus TaxID=79884 RepID=UPI00064DB88D|nr:SurA N-terminal domain-containing protein [Alkalihalobacillus pseudalcaliphilus]KMK76563.1 hypothetical protein AB990_15450 [Alkalihalobacillus pseudalcaliphilus]